MIDQWSDPVRVDLAGAWPLIQERARLMVESHRDRGVDAPKYDKIGSGTSTDYHFRGQVGEMAFSVWSSIPPPEIKPKRRGERPPSDNNGPDFYLRNHHGLNVKCAAPLRNLLPKAGVPLMSELYCLVWWEEGDLFARLVGWVDRGTMLAERYQRTFLPRVGLQLYYPWNELEKMADLEGIR